MYLYETLPTQLMHQYAEFFNKKDLKSKVDQLAAVQKKMLDLQAVFTYFTNNPWIYEQKLIDKFWVLMSPEEKEEFACDSHRINWKHALVGFSYGIRRYFMKEDCLAPTDGYRQLIAKNQIPWLNDIRYASAYQPALTDKNLSVYFPSLLQPLRFADYLQQRSIIKKFKVQASERADSYIDSSTVTLE